MSDDEFTTRGTAVAVLCQGMTPDQIQTLREMLGKRIGVTDAPPETAPAGASVTTPDRMRWRQGRLRDRYYDWILSARGGKGVACVTPIKPKQKALPGWNVWLREGGKWAHKGVAPDRSQAMRWADRLALAAFGGSAPAGPADETPRVLRPAGPGDCPVVGCGVCGAELFLPAAT